MERFVSWFRGGHLSSNGRCFDVGRSTQAALRRFEARLAMPTNVEREADHGAESWWECGSPDAAGNGCLMRLAPVVLAGASSGKAVVAAAAASCKLTHGAVQVCLTCLSYAWLTHSSRPSTRVVTLHHCWWVLCVGKQRRLCVPRRARTLRATKPYLKRTVNSARRCSGLLLARISAEVVPKYGILAT